MKQSKYPTLKFFIEPEEDISVYFSFEKEAEMFNRWFAMENYFFKKHLKIKPLKQTQDKKTKKEFLKKYVESYYKSRKKLIGKRVRETEKRWEKVEKIFFISSINYSKTIHGLKVIIKRSRQFGIFFREIYTEKLFNFHTKAEVLKKLRQL